MFLAVHDIWANGGQDVCLCPGYQGIIFVKRDIRLYRTQWAQPFALPEGAGSELQLRAIGSELTGMCVNMVLVRGMTY